jgi:hypothetical protein
MKMISHHRAVYYKPWTVDKRIKPMLHFKTANNQRVRVADYRKTKE